MTLPLTGVADALTIATGDLWHPPAAPPTAELEAYRTKLTTLILETPAASPADFAAKARNVAIYAVAENEWAPPRDDLPIDALATIDFVELVCAAAGVDRFGLPLPPELSRTLSALDLAKRAQIAGDVVLDEGAWTTPRDDLDWDELLLVDLVESLCARAGVDRLGHRL